MKNHPNSDGKMLPDFPCPKRKEKREMNDVLMNAMVKELGVARVSLPSIAISAASKALMQSMDALKSGVFTRLATADRLCRAQAIGNLIGA